MVLNGIVRESNEEEKRNHIARLVVSELVIIPTVHISQR